MDKMTNVGRIKEGMKEDKKNNVNVSNRSGKMMN